MTELVDKIRDWLGRLAPKPQDGFGTGAPSDGTPVPGEPTLGSALGMSVDAGQPEPGNGPAEG